MRWRFRPARDIGLPAGRRLRSHARDPGLLSFFVQQAWMLAMRLYLRAFHRLEVDGRERLPAEPPFVLVANHCSHLDALVLAAALPRRLSRQVFSLAAGEVFFDTLPAAGFASMAVNALPVWRKTTSAADLALLRERLAEDRLIYIMFPEGTRSRTGETSRFRPGIGALVAASQVPVVPCRLSGAHEAWPADRRLPRPCRVRLTIGAAMTFKAATDDRRGWTIVAAACETAVSRLRWRGGKSVLILRICTRAMAPGVQRCQGHLIHMTVPKERMLLHVDWQPRSQPRPHDEPGWSERRRPPWPRSRRRRMAPVSRWCICAPCR